MKPLLPVLLVLSSLLLSQNHHIVQLSGEEFNRPVEPSIAINPLNPDNIIAASIRYGHGYETRVVSMRYHSRDGGRNWSTFTELNPHLRSQGDDALTFSADGIAYHSFISFRGLRTNRPQANGIWVTSSEPNTDIWNEPVAVVDHINTLRPYEDKPYLCTDNARTSAHLGNLYIAWTRFDEYHSSSPYDSSQIYFARSTDGGKRFEAPYRISDTGGDCSDDDQTVEGAVPAVGPDGQIYIAWSGPKGMIFDRSMDGGKTFGSDQKVTGLPGGWNIDIDGIYRHNGFPVTKVDLSDGPNRGAVYVNWIDERNGDPDIFLIRSNDEGQSWTEPMRVNDDPVGNGKAQFFTWMAVDPHDGSVNVIFYDRRRQKGTKTELTFARSLDGGASFKNQFLDMQPFECNPEIFFGDYTNIDAFGGRIALIFSHFTGSAATAISAAFFNFHPGTHDRR